MPVPENVLDKDLYKKVKKEAKTRFERWPSAYGSAWLVKTYKKRGGRYSSRKSRRGSRKSRRGSRKSRGGSRKSKRGSRKSRRGSRNSKRGSRKSGVSRWMEEEWIQVVPYLKNGTIRECGGNNKQTKACRPLNRVNDKTPITIGELVKLHGKDEVLRLARKKNRDMDGRLYWKRGRFYSSD